MAVTLNSRETEIVNRALTAIVEGPFFPDWEFQTLFGVVRERMREELAKNPRSPEWADVHSSYVNSALFFLTTYPIKNKEPLAAFGVDLLEVAAIMKKLHPTAKGLLDYLE